jgi:ARG/rhodanese/phosphatase superfamily protein
MENAGRVGLAAALFLAMSAFRPGNGAQAAGGPEPAGEDNYRVLAPIESGNLLLFPVVRANGKDAAGTPFITLDEGIRSGEVEVTEAGNVEGLVRPRTPGQARPASGFRSAQVNTLVLVNNSRKPLLLLAGEIVTGGKQDRVIAKDRIVPVGADPIDLSVFCIEPGRWTASSTYFGGAASAPGQGFMAQPAVRQQAMVEKDQQQVWNSVHGAMAAMAMAAPPPTPTASQSVIVADGPIETGPGAFGTSSYARAMQSSTVSGKVNEAAAPAIQDREQVLEKLRAEHAVGVVAAVRGEIIWADVFADTDLLTRYWTKLVRSYAAESLAGGETKPAPTVEDAQRFLDAPLGGRETSEGDVGVYRYTELHGARTETFVLEALLPGTGYEVHTSKMKLSGEGDRVRP